MLLLLGACFAWHGPGAARAPALHRARGVVMAEPNPILGIASQGLGLLKPIFRQQADLQAAVLGRVAPEQGDRAAARAQIEADIGSAPCVVYTYGLSPFSLECTSLLDNVGAKVTKIELGPEWFVLGPKASAMRAELLAMTGQSSLPHVFIGGVSAGGLYSGNDVGKGLAALQQSGELTQMLEAAGGLA